MDIYLAGEFKAESSAKGLPQPKVIQVSDQELAAVAGSYFNFANNNFRRLYVKNGKLIYSRGSSESESRRGQSRATYTPPQLREFIGTFYSEEIEATYTIILKDDKLMLRRKNVDGETTLVGHFADAFSATGTGGIRFTRDNQNHLNGFLLTTGRVRNLRFIRSQP